MTKPNDNQNLEATDVAETSQQTQNGKLEHAARREFMIKALAATSGVALTGMLPSSVTETVAQTQSCPPTSLGMAALARRHGSVVPDI